MTMQVLKEVGVEFMDLYIQLIPVCDMETFEKIMDAYIG